MLCQAQHHHADQRVQRNTHNMEWERVQACSISSKATRQSPKEG